MKFDKFDKSNPKTPTNELHREMFILKVSDIYKTNILNFVHEILAGRSPQSLKISFSI